MAKKKKAQVFSYEVINHYDVWGNAKDGWEVNDSSNAGTVEFDDEPTNEEIWDGLVEDGIAYGPFKDAEFRDNGDSIEIDYKKNGRPVFTLNKIDRPNCGCGNPLEPGDKYECSTCATAERTIHRAGG
jgi:hypothetical protein